VVREGEFVRAVEDKGGKGREPRGIAGNQIRRRRLLRYGLVPDVCNKSSPVMFNVA